MDSTSDDDVRNYRLRVADVVNEPRGMLPPIEGFEKMPLVSIEESVEPLISFVKEIRRYALEAKKKVASSKKSAHGLTIDESAAIRLYTMEWKPKSLYTVLNENLRKEDRQSLKPWFSFLKLLMTALFQLPPISATVYRGVKLSLYQDYINRKQTIWWAFSSCARSLAVLENELFLGKSGVRTLFSIKCSTGRDISLYSEFPNESEVLLLPATKFNTQGDLDPGDGLHIIPLEEIDSTIFLPMRKTFESRSSSKPLVSPKQERETPMKRLPARHGEEIKLIADRYQSRQPVEISNEGLTDEDIPEIVERIIVGKRCTKLTLADNNIRSEGVSRIAHAARESDTLEELNLKKNHLTDEDIRPLADEFTVNDYSNEESSNCCSLFRKKGSTKGPLKILNLSHNDIGDGGVKYLTDIITTKQTLIELSLNDNQIGDQGVKYLAKALMHPDAKLQKLYLHNNPRITDQCTDDLIKMIKTNNSLNTLWLINCKLSTDGRQKLRKAAELKKNLYLNI